MSAEDEKRDAISLAVHKAVFFFIVEQIDNHGDAALDNASVFTGAAAALADVLWLGRAPHLTLEQAQAMWNKLGSEFLPQSKQREEQLHARSKAPEPKLN